LKKNNDERNRVKKVASLAGGCFGVQKPFSAKLKVLIVPFQYIGGHTVSPTREICNGDTGHAEAIELLTIKSISFGELLEVFFATHDPTTVID
jgi:peptide-methionine (S)-S-oxide reductase